MRLLFFLAACACAQSDSSRFEVASIKPTAPGAMGIMMTFTPGGGLTARNARVRQLITLAYDIQTFQLSGGPGWLDSEGYDIEAKSSSAGDARARLRALLADRFQLVLKREEREQSVYFLVVAKGGHKMKEASGEGHGLTVGRGEMTADKVGMEPLARMLGARTSRPVIDKTGLAGVYDFKLEWTPGPGEGIGKPGAFAPPPSEPDASGPSIFAALQQQLGLKLESQKAPIPFFVIERVEKPSAN